MRMRFVPFILLAVAILVQLAVPAGMIIRREMALHHGAVLRFRTAPVDPADAFRGRYVALGFDDRNAPCSERFRPHQTIYVRAETGTNGFAHLVEAARKPGTTGIWFRASAGWSTEERAVSVDLPFDRFYLDEAAAPKAEALYRSVNSRSPATGGHRACWLQVRVDRGLAVAEELLLDGVPIREAVRTAK